MTMPVAACHLDSCAVEQACVPDTLRRLTWRGHAFILDLSVATTPESGVLWRSSCRRLAGLILLPNVMPLARDHGPRQGRRSIAQSGIETHHPFDGTARVTDGGAPDLLQRLATTYIGPGVVFPAMPNPPPAAWSGPASTGSRALATG